MSDISYLRQEKGMCLHEIGAKVGVSESNISHWLKNSRQIPISRLNSLASALGIELIPDSLHSDLMGFLRNLAPNIGVPDIYELITLLSENAIKKANIWIINMERKEKKNDFIKKFKK